MQIIYIGRGTISPLRDEFFGQQTRKCKDSWLELLRKKIFDSLGLIPFFGIQIVFM